MLEKNRKCCMSHTSAVPHTKRSNPVRLVCSVLIVASLIAVAPVQALDVCSLVSRAEMAAAIGEPIASMRLSGPDLHTESGSQRWTCTYGLANGILAVIVAEFSSTSEARKFVTLENLKLKELDVQITEEGMGDRAFLFTDEGTQVFSVLKGARYLAMTAGGQKLPPDRVTASLRKIATMLLPKL
jgi:hypothetical protein